MRTFARPITLLLVEVYKESMVNTNSKRLLRDAAVLYYCSCGDRSERQSQSYYSLATSITSPRYSEILKT
jgi:hypothetical protein